MLLLQDGRLEVEVEHTSGHLAQQQPAHALQAQCLSCSSLSEIMSPEAADVAGRLHANQQVEPAVETHRSSILFGKHCI